ncbi:hypothetical protein VTO73DRAFT_5458 [Trametes versicolor]
MSISDQGDRWGFGAMDKETLLKLFDAFYEAGSKFRGIPDEIVVATKYTSPFVLARPGIKQNTSYTGSSQVYAHLRRRIAEEPPHLLHWYLLCPLVEYRTSKEEAMNGLHDLVVSGKVLSSRKPMYTYARFTGKTPFVIYQGAWSVLQWDFERKIIPMVRSPEGMALAPWNVLAAGKIRTDAEEASRRETGEKGRANFTAVPYVFPIVCGRKVEHLHANIEALNIVLTPEHIKPMESAMPFKPGFPSSFIGDGTHHHALGFLLVAHVDR